MMKIVIAYGCHDDGHNDHFMIPDDQQYEVNSDHDKS